MKTTLNFDDRLLRAAKQRAASEGETLTKLIEKALRRYLNPPAAKGKRFRLKLVVKKGRAATGIDWDDRDSVYDRMEGRS